MRELFTRTASDAAAGVTAVASTRDRIIDASVDLFGSRGVDAVSLDEIAREVGVRKQTVLYWFASKDALVDGVLDAVAAGAQGYLVKSTPGLRPFSARRGNNA
mgnify:CR=1 FL=1